MLAVVRTPHTNLRIEGEIPVPVLSALKKEYGNRLILKMDDEDALVPTKDTQWYKERKKGMTPGKYLRIYRENAGLTQEALGEKLGGLSRRYISDMENDRRAISKKVAKTLSGLLKIPVSQLI